MLLTLGQNLQTIYTAEDLIGVDNYRLIPRDKDMFFSMGFGRKMVKMAKDSDQTNQILISII